VHLLHKLPPPLGVKGVALYESANASFHMLGLVKKLQLVRNDEGMIFFPHALIAIAKSALPDHFHNLNNPRLEKRFEAKFAQLIQEKFKDALVKMQTSSTLYEMVDLTDEYNAATGLATVWRGKKARRRAVTLQETTMLQNDTAAPTTTKNEDGIEMKTMEDVVEAVVVASGGQRTTSCEDITIQGMNGNIDGDQESQAR
jgi:hypothetical protein